MLTILSTYLSTKSRANAFRDRAQLEAWQDQQVVAHLSKVLPRSPFFQARYGDRPLYEWPNFPLIDKSIMMANFSTLNTVGIGREAAFDVANAAEESRDFSATIGDITVGLSSGTSGNRGIFLVSKAERHRWVGAVLAKVLSHSIFSAQRIAFFLRANSNLYETVGLGRFQFSFFDLLDRPEHHITRLNRYQPTYLIGPPSLLRFLADAQVATRLSISPQKVISVAETLDPLDQQQIETAFNQTVHQVYQCTEGFLGSTCRYGTLHLHEDLAVFQKERLPNDPTGRRFVPIITDFHRFSQPILRYRLDDILTERATPCPCGSIMTGLEMIEGRCDDVLYLRSKTTGHSPEPVPLYPDFVRRAIIRTSDQISAYRVTQTGQDQWEVALDCPSNRRLEIEAVLRSKLEHLIQTISCIPPQIVFSPLPSEIPTVEKRRRIRCTWTLETTARSQI